MQRFLPSLPIAALAACGAPAGPAPAADIARASETPRSAAREEYPADLQRMLELTAFAQAPGRPCLYEVPTPRPAWADDPALHRRVRRVRSDSYWLGAWARDKLGERLAFARVNYDWQPGPDRTYPAQAPPLVYEIAVTGGDPIAPPPLGDRAAGVPVVVRYDWPIGDAEFMRRRDAGRPVASELVELLSEGGSPDSGGAVRLSVESDGGRPDPAALAHCDALRRAYRLPVLMEFMAGQVPVPPPALPAG